MNIEELKKARKETEDLKTRIEATFHQIIGKIACLDELIKKEEQISKNIPEEQSK